MDETNDEIDLRPYILTIVQHWGQIVAITLGVAILALVTSLLMPKAYESTATLLIASSRTRLNLAETFPTVTEPVDTRARMDAMLAIAQSDTLAQQVIQGLGDQLPPGERKIGLLKNRVKSTSRGDLILITARGDDPQLAAQIANAWAEQTATVINSAYSGEQPLAEIQNQLQSTKQEYEQAQSAYEAFLRDNQINLLEKRIGEAQTLLTEQSEKRTWQITYYTNRKQSMEALRVQAEALKLQLQGGSRSQAGSLGDALAVLLARAEAMGITFQRDSTQPAQPDTAPQPAPQHGITLNVQMGDIQSIQDSSANYAADLDGLIRLADDEIGRSQTALDTLQRAVNEGKGNDDLAATASQIGSLQTQYEDERSRSQELTSQRDLAWNAYQAMAQKEAELTNATQVNNRIILVNQAVPPERPATHGPIWNTVIGGMLGLILATVVVLAVYWWGSTNPDRQAVTPSPENR